MKPLGSAKGYEMMLGALAKCKLGYANFGEKGLLIIFRGGYMDIHGMCRRDSCIRGTKKAEQILSPRDENGGKGGFITGRTSTAPASYEASEREWLALWSKAEQGGRRYGRKGGKSI
jgi:hypothetical protein